MDILPRLTVENHLQLLIIRVGASTGINRFFEFSGFPEQCQDLSDLVEAQYQ